MWQHIYVLIMFLATIVHIKADNEVKCVSEEECPWFLDISKNFPNIDRSKLRIKCGESIDGNILIECPAIEGR